MNNIGEILDYENKKYKVIQEKVTGSCTGCYFKFPSSPGEEDCMILDFSDSPFECGSYGDTGKGIIYAETPTLCEKLKQL